MPRKRRHPAAANPPIPPPMMITRTMSESYRNAPAKQNAAACVSQHIAASRQPGYYSSMASSFTFAVLNDLHYTTPDDRPWLDDLVRRVNATPDLELVL